jgi:nitric oxide reductase large subunit
MIAVVWITAGLIAVGHAVLVYFGEFSVRHFLMISFIAMCLLIIFVSYVSIVTKVRCGAQPQHHGATSRERKLTMTLLIVTVVSLLLYLPFVILGLIFSSNEILKSPSSSEIFHLSNVMLAFYYANHLVNPILYAIRKPEYRSAVLALLRKRPQQQRRVADLPLRDM